MLESNALTRSSLLFGGGAFGSEILIYLIIMGSLLALDSLTKYIPLMFVFIQIQAEL